MRAATASPEYVYGLLLNDSVFKAGFTTCHTTLNPRYGTTVLPHFLNHKIIIPVQANYGRAIENRIHRHLRSMKGLHLGNEMYTLAAIPHFIAIAEQYRCDSSASEALYENLNSAVVIKNARWCKSKPKAVAYEVPFVQALMQGQVAGFADAKIYEKVDIRDLFKVYSEWLVEQHDPRACKRTTQTFSNAFGNAIATIDEKRFIRTHHGRSRSFYTLDLSPE